MASPNARASSTTATAASGACWASRARTSWPILAATIALAAPGRPPEATVLALSGEEAGGRCPQGQSAERSPLQPAGRGWQLVDYELAGRRRHQESPGPRLPDILGKEGSERAR